MKVGDVWANLDENLPCFHTMPPPLAVAQARACRMVTADGCNAADSRCSAGDAAVAVVVCRYVARAGVFDRKEFCASIRRLVRG